LQQRKLEIQKPRKIRPNHCSPAVCGSQKICNTFATKARKNALKYGKLPEIQMVENGNRKTLKPLRLKGFLW